MNLPEGVEFLLSPKLFRSTQGAGVMGKLTASRQAAALQRLLEHRRGHRWFGLFDTREVYLIKTPKSCCFLS